MIRLPRRLEQSPFIKGANAALFAFTGHRTGNRWYSRFKRQQMDSFLVGSLDIRNLTPGYGRWIDERMVEYPWCFANLSDDRGSLLDAGSVLNFDYILDHPKVRQKELTIMTLAPEAHSYWRRGISYLYGDLRSTGFRDDYFDEIVSLSTIEHVGLDNSRYYPSGEQPGQGYPVGDFRGAIREFRRILKPGGTLLLSVPFGTHSVRDWLQVFDGPMVDSIVETFSPASHTVTYFRYEDERGWHASSRRGAADSRYFDYRTDQPWQGHPAAAEAVACVALMK